MRIKWRGRSTSGLLKWNFEADTMRDLYHILVSKGIISTVDKDPYCEAMLNKVGLSESDFTEDEAEKYNDNYYEWFEKATDGIYLSEVEYKEIIENENGNAYYQDFEIEEEQNIDN